MMLGTTVTLRSDPGKTTTETQRHRERRPGARSVSLCLSWFVFCGLPYLYLRQHVFQECSIGSRIGRRLFGGRADLAALDHDRSVEAGGLQRGEDRGEVDLARAELDHDVALERGAVLGTEPRDMLRDRLQFFNRVLAGV